MSAWEIFRSVEHIWIIWFVGMIILIPLTWKILRGLRWKTMRQVAVGEDGAAYSIAYVLTLPIYILLIALVIESTLILIAKMGTVYSAYAAARSAIVWESARSGSGSQPELMNDKSQLAAVQAMAPFASSASIPGGGGSPGRAAEYFRAYQAHSNGKAPVDYITAKYRFAEQATRTTIRDNGSGMITVTVTYQTPLHIPGAARILGGVAPSWGGQGRVYLVQTSVSLPSESPPTKDEPWPLGIEYESE